MRLTKDLKEQIQVHATDCYPDECCGLIVDGVYHPCQNMAPNPKDGFEIDPATWVELSERGKIQAVVHSHPDGSSEPSEVDKVQMGLHGVDWVIVGLGVHSDGEKYCNIKSHKPKAYQAPLIGREYYHGTQDCYSLVRDYYERELGITLPDFPRVDSWWEDANHEPLYEQNFGKAGFEQVHDLQKHDVILCRVGRTHHVNHALIYLGDYQLQSENAPPAVGNQLVLHHPHGRLSVREVYGDSWQRRTAMIVRYTHENH